MTLYASRSWGAGDWVIIGLRVLGFIFTLVNVFNNEANAEKFGYFLSFAILSLAIPQLFYLPGHIKPKLFIATELIMSIGFTLYMTIYIEDAKGYLLLPMFVIGFMCSKTAFFLIAPSCTLILPLFFYFYRALEFENAFNYAINIGLFSILGFILGVFLRQKNQLANMLQVIEEKNRALEHSLRQIERLTLLEERNRMARELHDTVGHSLTASIVAMEAVHTLIDQNQEVSKIRLKQLIEFNRNHLNDFRRTVHDMAMNELKLPLVELLGQKVDEFSNQTGTNVVLETEGETRDFIPEAVKMSMLRCLQESMTNAKKHGNATEIRITIKAREDLITLQIRDNGCGSDDLVEGFGVEGMKARIEALQGKLRIVSKKGEGTTVSCEIPIGG